MSLGEYVVLTASLKAALEPKVFNCHNCILEYGKSERLVKKTDRKRKIRGCHDFKTKKYKVSNIIFKSCVGNYTINIDFLIDSFHKYESNMLPYNGTLGEQPYKIIELFNIIRSQVNEHREKQEKAQ